MTAERRGTAKGGLASPWFSRGGKIAPRPRRHVRSIRDVSPHARKAEIRFRTARATNAITKRRKVRRSPPFLSEPYFGIDHRDRCTGNHSAEQCFAKPRVTCDLRRRGGIKGRIRTRSVCSRPSFNPFSVPPDRRRAMRGRRDEML